MAPRFSFSFSGRKRFPFLLGLLSALHFCVIASLNIYYCLVTYRRTSIDLRRMVIELETSEQNCGPLIANELMVVLFFRLLPSQCCRRAR